VRYVNERDIGEYSTYEDNPHVGRDVFLARKALGRVVVGYSLYGTIERPLHAFIWAIPDHPSQFIDQRISAKPRSYENFKLLVAQAALDGYFPAYVSATGHPSFTGFSNCYFSAIFEPYTGTRKPFFTGVAHMRKTTSTATALVEQIEAQEAERRYVRSVGVLGIPTPGDFNDPSAADVDPAQTSPNLWVFATFWPLPPDAGFISNVHLTPNRSNRLPGSEAPGFEAFWKDRWETQALGPQAYPVFVQRTRHRDGLGACTLSLWHDVRYEPWPAPDPFSETAPFDVAEVLQPNVEGTLSAHEDESTDRRPISFGVTTDGDMTWWNIVFGRKGDETPLPKHLVLRDAFGLGKEYVREPSLPGPLGQSGAPQTAEPGGTDGQAGNAPNVGRALLPVEDWLVARLRRTGARQGRIVVVRRGGLPLVSAITRAEVGYPVARIEDPVRLASVSKFMTALMVIRNLAAALADGLDTKLSSILSFRAAAPERIRNITVRDLLCHYSMIKNASLALEPPAIARLLAGQPKTAYNQKFFRIEPGDLSRYLEQYTGESYFRAGPKTQCAFQYCNYGSRLVGEIYALAVHGELRLYAEAADLLLRETDSPRPDSPFLANGPLASWEAGEAPGHPQMPGFVWNRHEVGNPDSIPGASGQAGTRPGPMAPSRPTPAMTSPVYGWDGPYSGPSGGWCVPALTIARVLAALTQREDENGSIIEPYLSDVQLHQMAALRQPDCANSFAHGVSRADATFQWAPGAPTQDVVRIYKNGIIDGGGTLIAHQFPRYFEDDRRETLSFFVALNQWDELGLASVNEIFHRLEGMIHAGTLPSADRFDELL
jgi:hypothetical protein